MASSNRHWPSMFRANPACGFQPQSDMMNNNPHSHGSSSSLLGGPKPSLLSSGMDQEGGGGGRSTETKPRWSPRPEQIRILEGIFNSGTVNPPRDEIRCIRARLQEFGPVADANVFYWFQNRKSRTKHKLRAAAARASSSSSPAPAPPVTPPPPPRKQQQFVLGSNNSSSSSSSERSSGSSGGKAASVVKPRTISGCGQLYYHHHHPIPAPAPAAAAAREMVIGSREPPAPLTLQWPPPPQSQQYYYCLPATELGGVVLGYGGHALTPAMASPGAALGHQDNIIDDMSSYAAKGPCDTNGQYSINGAAASAGVSDAMMSAAFAEEDEKASWLGGSGLLHYGLGSVAASADPAHAAASASDVISTAAAPRVNAAASSALTGQLQVQELLDAGGLIGGGAAAAAAPMATVVAMAAAWPDAGAVQCYSLPAMARLDVARLFGEAALLLRHTGEPVPVDAARGVTLEHGALYYVLV